MEGTSRRRIKEYKNIGKDPEVINFFFLQICIRNYEPISPFLFKECRRRRQEMSVQLRKVLYSNFIYLYKN